MPRPRFLPALVPILALLLRFPPAELAASGGNVIDLWPEGVPGQRSDVPPEVTEKGRTSHVSHPTLTVTRPPAGRAVPTAVIICPGGAYAILAIDKEGSDVAAWLAGRGITAFVLRYRLRDYGHPAPLRDVLRAVRIVRSRASEFGVSSTRIGVMGFSAGGHLAASAGTLYDLPEGRTGAPLDKVSGRPDFLVLLYPVITMSGPDAHAASRHNLLGEHPTEELERRLSPELHVNRKTPPAFIVQAEDDTGVRVQNSLLFFGALRDAGVPSELHIFPHGGHGFGLARSLPEVSEWPRLCEAWMRAQGWLPAAPATAPSDAAP